MRSLRKRLKRLEDASRRSSRTVSAKALKAISDEDLDALEETLETALASGEGGFEGFYAVVSGGAGLAAVVWRSLGWAPVQYDAGKDPENEGRGRGPGWIIAYTAPPSTHPTRHR